MQKFICVIVIWSILFFLSGCWLKAGTGSPMGFKRITPSMEKEMEQLINAGCDKEYQYYDREIAFLYSIIPGGGQWYTGEKEKAWLYLLSSPLIVPYIVSFQDAQNSVDYYNFRYTAKFCKSKFKIAKKKYDMG
ncbi:MAG: hypothetical protein CMH75_07265 [Nitrospina sp.]|nr:hypothetical protein [Nitrospina sp.]|tara:strand:+ start:295 stop:696 length:402 start_codon:yes stop_codon:yes gene_type:complete